MAVITVNGWFRIPQATVTNNGELLIAESLFGVLCSPCCLSHRAGKADSLRWAGVSRERLGGIAGSLLKPSFSLWNQRLEGLKCHYATEKVQLLTLTLARAELIASPLSLYVNTTLPR